MVDRDRLAAAYKTARADLLAECEPSGHWIGELSTSALSTATAVSALALVERHCGPSSTSSKLPGLIVRGLDWLARHQNADGGFGDTDKSHSNIATTMLVRAAFHLTALPADHADLLARAERYIASQGGVAGLRRRYGKDKTFAVPILTNAALAGLVRWRDVPPLPFELACVPQGLYRFLRLPVVSYAIPALVAIGQARFHHRPPLNPLTRWLRRSAVEKSLRVIGRMQPDSGGYLEAVPLTSFVVMSLAGSGRAEHPVVRNGVRFLVDSVRADGSWPIDTNLATWNTTLAMNALAAAGEDAADVARLEWLLSCQHTQPHPFTGATPGGWAWTDLSGGVPDVDDTSGALLALANCRASRTIDADLGRRIDQAALAGVRWLLELQNRDGGWPTFCRGWGTMPFDRSGSDLTAHALRALDAWRRRGMAQLNNNLDLEKSVRRGLAFLARRQRPDGSWVPLWFGNQDLPGEENPVYGTARVLLAYRDLKRLDTPAAGRGLGYLARVQNPDGGWGGACEAGRNRTSVWRSSVEETALAVESLLSCASSDSMQNTVAKGLAWLTEAVETQKHQETSPLGFYFAKLWYYERLYPLTFAVSALGQAARLLLPRPERRPHAAHPLIPHPLSRI